MKEAFLVTPKQNASVTMTLRISEGLRDRLEEVSVKSGHSKNELIKLAIDFALEHLEFSDAE